MILTPANARIVLLLAFQAILSLGIAVVADRISAIISLRLPELVAEPGLYVFGGCLVALSVATGLLSLRSDHTHSDAQAFSDNAAIVRLPGLLLLPFSTMAGAGVSLLSILLTPAGVAAFTGWYSHTYEIATWAVGFVALSALAFKERRRVLPTLTTFSVGYSIGAASSILMLRPDENKLSFTVAGWLAAMLSAAVVVAWLSNLPRRPHE